VNFFKLLFAFFCLKSKLNGSGYNFRCHLQPASSVKQVISRVHLLVDKISHRLSWHPDVFLAPESAAQFRPWVKFRLWISEESIISQTVICANEITLNIPLPKSTCWKYIQVADSIPRLLLAKCWGVHEQDNPLTLTAPDQLELGVHGCVWMGECEAMCLPWTWTRSITLVTVFFVVKLCLQRDSKRWKRVLVNTGEMIFWSPRQLHPLIVKPLVKLLQRWRKG